MAYRYTNSKGRAYYLHAEEVTLRNGRKQMIYYFAPSEKEGKGLDKVPSGHNIGENPRTGLPFLRKA